MPPTARTWALPSAGLYRTLLEGVESGAALVDSRGRILYANRALARLTGIVVSALKGRRFTGLLSGRRKESLLKPGRVGTREMELYVLARKGPPVPALVRVDRMPGTGIACARVESLLLQKKYEGVITSGRVTRAVFNEVSEAIVVLSRQGIVLRASQAAWRLAGRNPIARPFDEVFPLSLQLRGKPILPARLQATLLNAGLFRCEGLLDPPDGHLRHLLISSRRLHLEGGVESGSVVVMTDITDSKRFEEELRTANEQLQRRVEERTANLVLLYDLARTSNEAESAGQALSLALERICRHGGWDFGQAYLREEKPPKALSFEAIWAPDPDLEALATQLRPGKRILAPTDSLRCALESGRLEWTDKLSRNLGVRARIAAAGGLRTVAAVPVRRGPEVLGILELFSRSRRRLDDAARAALDAAGLQLGEVVDRKRLQKEFAEAVSQEHETIGRELHDSVGQELTGLALMMRALPSGGRRKTQAVTKEVTKGLQRVLREVHDLSRGVFPAELTSLGLAGGIARLVEQTSRRSGFQCRFDNSTGTLRMNPETTLQVFRVAQEAVNNAVKYSGGSKVRIRLSRRGSTLELDVQDDGRGLPKRPGSLSGSGLRIMRFRAEAIGGTLRLRRARGGGTRVTCRWKPAELTPLPGEE
jgi:PAS domain S-box-containing protein